MRRVIQLIIFACFVASIFVFFNLEGRAQGLKAAKLLHTIGDGYGYWWSPDNKTLAVLNKDILLYDALTGGVRAQVQIGGKQIARGVYFTADSSALIVHADRIRLYSLSDGKLLRQFGEGTEPINYYERVYKPEQVFGYNSDSTQYEYENKAPSNGEELMELPARFSSNARIMSPGGKALLVRTKDGKPQVYDLSTGELKFTLEPLTQTGNKRKGWGDALGEFSSDGRFIVTSYRNRMPRLWDAATGNLIADLVPQSDIVYGVRFSHDSKLVATTSFDGVVKIWDTTTGKLRNNIGSKKERNYFAVWNPRNNSFVTKTPKWEVDIWDAETGLLISRLDDAATQEKFDENLTFEFSPDGKILLTKAKNSSNFASLLSKKKQRVIAYLWDAARGSLIAPLRDTKPRDGYDYVYDKFLWVPGGDLLISAGITVKLWDRRGELVQELDGNAMMGASLSPDGTLLAVTAGKQETVRSMIADAAKIMVGKLPKLVSKTYVWQVGD
jgi:WD40 repeat protein